MMCVCACLQGLAPNADISATKHKIEDLRRGCCHPQVFDSAIRAKVLVRSALSTTALAS